MAAAGPDQSELIHVSDVEGIRVVTVLTDIDSVTTDLLLPLLHDATEGRERAILSLQCCEYCDSHGLAMLIAFSRSFDGRCVLTPSPQLRRLFEVTGLDKVLPLGWSVADALQKLLHEARD